MPGKNPIEDMLMKEVRKEEQQITVRTEERKYGKVMTIVEGINEKEMDLEDLGKKLKSKLACGGTVKDGRIELQGNHKHRMKDILVDLGYSTEMINVK